MSPLNPLRQSRAPRHAASWGAILVIGLLGAIATVSTATQRQATKRVAGEAHNPVLGKTVLTTVKGRTLYSLSAERRGKFICTGSCRSTWPPLLVPADVKPRGPVKLGAIARPDGGIQVTYRGRPLYRFSGDLKAGQVNGEGIEDVGTWHAAVVPQESSTPQPPAESTPPYPPPPSPQPYPPVESPPPYPY